MPAIAERRDLMNGTLINIATVLVGGALGLLFGSRLPERLKQTIMAGLGLFTALIGISMFLKTQQPLIVLGALLVGGLLGEWWRIEDGLQALGGFFERRFNHGGDAARFVRGFLTASLLFCVGPMTILGSLENGLTGNFETLAIKSVLDGFAALAFASTLGVGVLFSTVVILIYQGSITLLAAQLSPLFSQSMINEMSATGGVILVGIALSSLLELKKIRVGSFLPALVIAPLIVAVLAWLGVK
jgi:uncharacterized membrane protein YqgA involved in biofilm formation